MRTEFLFTDPPFAACHAASLAETPHGLVAAWFGGSREGAPDVGIWISRREFSGWSQPEKVADGLESGWQCPCWNPVLYQMPAGPLLLFYKVGPSPEQWWGMLALSSDGGFSWEAPQRLPEGILGPIKNKPVCLSDGTLLCPSSQESGSWQVQIERTCDVGQTWEKVAVPGDFQAIQPAILQHPAGVLQLLCRSTCGWIVTSWSQDGGKTWRPLAKTSLPNPNSGIDALTLKDGRHVVVYNPTGMIPGRWGGERTPLCLAVSNDGIDWQPGLVLESSPGEYSYPAVIQTQDGLIHILYTWQRQNICHAWLEPAELEA
jgi:predicted neuraminidase